MRSERQGEPTPSDEEFLVDTALLARAVRMQGRAWLLLGPVLCVLLLALCLLLVPQTYTSTASVAIQQSMPTGSGALALLGGQTENKRYLGILKSRSAAAYVERLVNLNGLYRFDSQDDESDYLIKHVTATDDSTDDLLYINAGLPGPSKYMPGMSTRRRAVALASAEVANAYTAALRDYYVNNDTDRDAVLVRDADQEVRKSRAQYDAAAARLEAFSRSLGRYDPRATPSVASVSTSMPDAGSGGAEGTEVARLYGDLEQVNVQIRAAQAAQTAQQNLVNGQLHDLPQIPGEDPLLNIARNRVTYDKGQLASLRVQYGQENPEVVLAQQRLKIDQAELAKQVQGVKDQLTTQHVASATDLKSLQARQTALEAQIDRADNRLLTSRQLSVSMGALQVDAELRLDELRATLEEAAKVRLDNVSAQSRMSVVDTAIPDRHPKPSLAILAGASAGLVLLAFIVFVLRDYRRAGRAAQFAPVPSAAASASPPTNGASPESAASAGMDDAAIGISGRRP